MSFCITLELRKLGLGSITVHQDYLYIDFLGYDDGSMIVYYPNNINELPDEVEKELLLWRGESDNYLSAELIEKIRDLVQNNIHVIKKERRQ
ncbi:hypothetical protein [Candidatus Nitrosocosmicus sp. FF01]|uniref:hypothetical protein n=1 Tax=Candidatus Nitrosocosmicus sp. FF01 TaxID=3397670 RepID=UPI0039E8F84A